MVDEVTLTTISQLPEQTVAPAAADEIVIQKVGAPAETRRLKWSNIWSFLTGGKVIGGAAAGDVMDTNSSQVAINKRFNLPKMNSAVNMESTSEDLNKLKAINELSRDDLVALVGSANAQTLATRLANVVSAVDDINVYIDGTLTDLIQDLQNSLDVTPVVYTAEVGIGAGIEKHIITEADIMSALGLVAPVKLSHLVEASYGENTGSGLIFGDIVTNGSIYSTVTGGITHLDRIEFIVVAGKTYWFHILVHRV